MHLWSPQRILQLAPQLHLTCLCSATKCVQKARQVHDLIPGIPVHIHCSLAIIMPVELWGMNKDVPITKQCVLGRMHLLRHQTGSRLFDCRGNNRSNNWQAITL